MFWPDPTHQLNHPPTKLYTHPWVENSSQISNLQMELKYLDSFKCYRILTDSGGPSLGGVADGWLGVEVGMGVWSGILCMHTCTHMHACMHMHDKHDKHDKHGCLHVGGHVQFLYMYTCACMHVHACACMWGHPHAPRCPQTHPTYLPPTQSRREPKTPKFNNSWTNRDNSILFEDSLPLNIPEFI